ncbi:MAG: peptide chain release factor N(5)-glutamine methyltransferase [Anaerolineales bacterium]|nr:peptide chain release factor N(5)-glutamine methyltransferase [Anaerolineales bacterium]
MLIKDIPPTLETNTIQAALRQASKHLQAYSDTATQDAQVLLAAITGQPRPWVIAHPEASLTPSQQENLETALVQLEAGQPLPYVLGEWEFYGLKFMVTPDVLIPRPETELLVETAIAWLEAHPAQRRMGEVGTGSGCITISLAVNVPDLVAIASDVSIPACFVARTNVLRHIPCSQVAVVQDNLLAVNRGPFDLLCANLPYIPTGTLESLAVFGREPTLALDGGADGLDLIRQLLDLCPHLLAPGGMALFEIGAEQGKAAQQIARQAFPAAQVNVKSDLAGHARLLIIET